MNAKWDLRFMEMAILVSGWSKDPSTKVGAIITDDKYVVSVGYNGLPKNYPATANEDAILGIKPLKYDVIIHGEINALIHAHRRLEGCTLYTYPFPPCSRCASIMVEAGIKRVVSGMDIPERWKENMKLSEDIFNQAGVEIIGVNI